MYIIQAMSILYRTNISTQNEILKKNLYKTNQPAEKQMKLVIKYRKVNCVNVFSKCVITEYWKLS